MMPATPDDIATLRDFDRRINEILAMLGDRPYLPPHENERARELYTSLKRDLESEAARNTAISYAVRAARGHLRAATNTNPIKSHWRSILYEAQVDIRHAIASNSPQSDS
jgi:hypothetical protein